jgi:hypothetical protein
VTDLRPLRTETERAGRRPRRWLVLVGGVGLTLALTACTAPLPDVTFYGNRAAVSSGPTRWCTLDYTAQTVTCTETPADQAPRLSLRPGQPVQINVPSAVADQPWTVYFGYINEAGELQTGRSEIFSDGRLAYTLHPFNETDQFVYVEVRSGFELTPGTAGGVEYASTQGWSLRVDPAAPAAGTNE